jgi:tetratricopeptide (TPR) repeat protein
LQEYERAIEDFGRAIELNPEDATAYHNRGSTYGDLQEYEQAIEDYDRAIELNPEYATAYNNRGLAYAHLQEYERAIEDYGRAIELDPEDARPYLSRGAAYAQLQDARAIEDLERAAELVELPYNAEVYYRMACLCPLMGKAGEAYEWLEKAIGLDEKYREMARGEEDFDGIREDERFKALVGESE